MGRDAVLSECAQHLGSSSYEYEKLLGSSVNGVWQALESYIQRQLVNRKGVNVPVLGKLTFLRDVHPLTPVFILADRFATTYGVSWKRPPPALLTPTVDVNMSVIGHEVNIPKEQAVRTLEALLAFTGSRLQKGVASGRLRIGSVGFVCLEGKALSFAFNPAFVKSVSQQSESKSVATSGASFASCSPLAAGVFDARSNNKATMQRSLSLDSTIPPMASMKMIGMATLSLNAAPASHSSGGHHDTHKEREHDHRRHKHKEKRDKTRDHHSKSTAALDSMPQSLARESSNSSRGNVTSNPSLPRFLLASKRIPDGAKVCLPIPGSQYALVMQSAFERESEHRKHSSHMRGNEDAVIGVLHQATRMRKLQQRAEQAIGRRELNAFLNDQIEEKQSKQWQARLDAAKATNYDAVKILPQDPLVSEATKREVKQTLCKRLEDQVAAKEALKADKRILEQAESAYYVAKLKAQAEQEHREQLELRRLETEAMLDDWKQQRALRHDDAIASKCRRQ